MAGPARPSAVDPCPRRPLPPPPSGLRGQGNRGADLLSAERASALKAEEARLARFFAAIDKHRKALDLAIEENFGGALDPTEWRSAFDSIDPRDANRTMVVTGDHSAILNALVEALRASAGARLIGLLPHRRPHANQVFDALLADGGISEEQASLLNDLYVLEGRLEHASPDVDAEEVRDGVERLRTALPGLIESVDAWLGRHSIEFR